MFPKITTDEVFGKMIDILLDRAKADEASNQMYHGEYSAGCDDGYIAALEDLKIVLSGGDRSNMNRPHYYRFDVDSGEEFG